MSLVEFQFCESCVPSYCSPHCYSRKIPTGTLFLNCERLKHNGLQDDCRRLKCDKNENCVAAQKTSDYRSMREIANCIKYNGLQQEYKRSKYKFMEIDDENFN